MKVKMIWLMLEKIQMTQKWLTSLDTNPISDCGPIAIAPIAADRKSEGTYLEEIFIVVVKFGQVDAVRALVEDDANVLTPQGRNEQVRSDIALLNLPRL